MTRRPRYLSGAGVVFVEVGQVLRRLRGLRSRCTTLILEGCSGSCSSPCAVCSSNCASSRVLVGLRGSVAGLLVDDVRVTDDCVSLWRCYACQAADGRAPCGTSGIGGIASPTGGSGGGSMSCVETAPVRSRWWGGGRELTRQSGLLLSGLLCARWPLDPSTRPSLTVFCGRRLAWCGVISLLERNWFRSACGRGLFCGRYRRGLGINRL